jgi:hypothetical protein
MFPNGARSSGVAVEVPHEHSSRRALLAKAGLVAAGVGAAALRAPSDAAGATLRDSYTLQPPAGSPALLVRPSGAVSESVSTGGAMNVDNTPSTGAGLVLYSDRGADAIGRLLVVNQANAANPQHAVRIANAGVGHTMSIFHDPAAGAGDSTALALDVVSTNPLDTTVGVHGREQGRGTVKITHEKPPSGGDSGASAISIALRGAGTAAQGIFIGNDAGEVTTGHLLNLRNGGPGTERLVLTAGGQLRLAIQGPGGGLLLGNDAALYRAAPATLATDGTLQAGSLGLRTGADQARLYFRNRKLVVEWSDGVKILYTTVPLDSPGPYPATVQVTTDTTAP